MDLEELIDQAIAAVDKEIEAVLERPSHDILQHGEKVDSKTGKEHHYKFESGNPSLRFAEVFDATIEGKSFAADLVEVKDQDVILGFTENLGNEISEVELEWENDFILRKIRDELFRLKSDPDADELDLTNHLFDPDNRVAGEAVFEAYDDGNRNDSQYNAIEKALNNEVTYIWGPPGTGKTATLGYIIANYLLHDKAVLFASNTNRAVDVGTLSVLDALKQLGETAKNEKITRFGETALDSRTLNDVLFDNQLEAGSRKKKEKAVKLQQTLTEYVRLSEEAEDILNDGKKLPQAMDVRLELLAKEMDRYGGEDGLEETIDRLLRINEMVELRKKNLVCTTLARVCTSDLFNGLTFDAVVIDEASMANLPYLLVLASKARKHIVIVGDPMQLPPIAMTNDFKAKDFMEMDIFTYVSGAKTTSDLFQWHDQNESFTCFFDVQYRLNEDLADIISKVFYEGRLKTAENKLISKDSEGQRSISVLDSSSYNPVLTQKNGDRGFQPLNEVHIQLISELVKKMVLSQYVPMFEIGIMVPFRSTVYDLRRELHRSGFGDVEVGTIHTFQGREKQVIIFDTVMSGEITKNGRSRHYSVRPFDETKNGLSVPRLLNVAFSRSRKNLFVIADMRHINKVYKNKFLGRLLSEMSSYKKA